jgi:hypothetical protein
MAGRAVLEYDRRDLLIERDRGGKDRKSRHKTGKDPVKPHFQAS